MKKQVLKLRPQAKMFKSQIQFQTTYNIKDGGEILGTAFTEKEAWERACNALTTFVA